MNLTLTINVQWPQNGLPIIDATAGPAFLGEPADNAAEWEDFLSEIEKQYGREWFTAGKIVAEIRNETPLTLPDCLGDIDQGTDGGLERALGKSFAKRLGIRYGQRELCLDRTVDKHTKSAKWRVLTRETAGHASTPGISASKLQGFLECCCIVSSDQVVSASEMELCYLAWCRRAKQRGVTRTEFCSQMKAGGFGQSRLRLGGRQQRCWIGIGLKREGEAQRSRRTA